MNAVFVDTSFYQALLNPRDSWHETAVSFSQEFRGQTITSEYVLCELGALMGQPHLRSLFLTFTETLTISPQVVILSASNDHFRAGIQLFSNRLDKEWSLTDCISFSMMEGLRIAEALTFDHHFEQAGFQPLPLRHR